MPWGKSFPHQGSSSSGTGRTWGFSWGSYLNAIGNLADPCFICFCIHASLGMPASSCHFEGKDKNFQRVPWFAPTRLCPSSCGVSFFLLTSCVGRGHFPDCSAPQSLSSRTRVKELPWAGTRHFYVGGASLEAKKEKTNWQKLTKSLIVSAQTWINRGHSLSTAQS